MILRMAIIIEYLFVKYFSVISICWKQHFLFLHDSTKNTFDNISFAQITGKLSAVYAVIKYLLWPPSTIRFNYTYLLTYLLICKFRMCESVQKILPHIIRTSHLLFHFFLHTWYHDYSYEYSYGSWIAPSVLFQLAGLWMTLSAE